MNTISFSLGRYKGAFGSNENNNNNNFNVEIERSSCWAVLSIDSIKIEAKIMHKGRGRFIILEDNYRGKYIDKIVDASDVVRCKF